MFQIFRGHNSSSTHRGLNKTVVFCTLRDRFFAVLSLLFITAALSASASAVTVDFTPDTTGNKPNGYQSPQSNQISFSDSNGAGLAVDNYSPQSIGNGLAVFGDDASKLIMNFSQPVNSLSLVFGNDDTCCSSAGDRARLTLFLGATQVGQVFVTMNRNDAADQTISFSGANFDSARFVYVNSTGTGTPTNLIKIVDNITFDVISTDPDLAVDLIVSPDPVAPGGDLTYQITLTNSGGVAAQNVVLTQSDFFRQRGARRLVVTSITAPDGFTCGAPNPVVDPALAEVVCRGASLAAGQSVQFTIVKQQRTPLARNGDLSRSGSRNGHARA